MEIDGICHCLDTEHRVNGKRLRENETKICTEANCLNGFCSSPDNCECLDGYEKDENLLCAAVNETCIDDSGNCNVTFDRPCYCINGICTANGSCVCVNGFKMSENHNNQCEPECTKECVSKSSYSINQTLFLMTFIIQLSGEWCLH